MKKIRYLLTFFLLLLAWPASAQQGDIVYPRRGVINTTVTGTTAVDLGGPCYAGGVALYGASSAVVEAHKNSSASLTGATLLTTLNSGTTGGSWTSERSGGWLVLNVTTAEANTRVEWFCTDTLSGVGGGGGASAIPGVSGNTITLAGMKSLAYRNATNSNGPLVTNVYGLPVFYFSSGTSNSGCTASGWGPDGGCWVAGDDDRACDHWTRPCRSLEKAAQLTSNGAAAIVLDSYDTWTADEDWNYAGNPSEIAATSLTQTGGTATFDAASNHGLTTGDGVEIILADDREYNVVNETVTVLDPDTFTYAVDSGAPSPTSNAVLLKENDYANRYSTDFDAVRGGDSTKIPRSAALEGRVTVMLSGSDTTGARLATLDADTNNWHVASDKDATITVQTAANDPPGDDVFPTTWTIVQGIDLSSVFDEVNNTGYRSAVLAKLMIDDSARMLAINVDLGSVQDGGTDDVGLTGQTPFVGLRLRGDNRFTDEFVDDRAKFIGINIRGALTDVSSDVANCTGAQAPYAFCGGSGALQMTNTLVLTTATDTLWVEPYFRNDRVDDNGLPSPLMSFNSAPQDTDATWHHTIVGGRLFGNSTDVDGFPGVLMTNASSTAENQTLDVWAIDTLFAHFNETTARTSPAVWALVQSHGGVTRTTQHDFTAYNVTWADGNAPGILRDTGNAIDVVNLRLYDIIVQGLTGYFLQDYEVQAGDCDNDQYIFEGITDVLDSSNLFSICRTDAATVAAAQTLADSSLAAGSAIFQNNSLDTGSPQFGEPNFTSGQSAYHCNPSGVDRECLAYTSRVVTRPLYIDLPFGLVTLDPNQQVDTLVIKGVRNAGGGTVIYSDAY